MRWRNIRRQRLSHDDCNNSNALKAWFRPSLLVACFLLYTWHGPCRQLKGVSSRPIKIKMLLMLLVMIPISVAYTWMNINCGDGGLQALKEGQQLHVINEPWTCGTQSFGIPGVSGVLWKKNAMQFWATEFWETQPFMNLHYCDSVGKNRISTEVQLVLLSRWLEQIAVTVGGYCGASLLKLRHRRV